MYARSSEMRLNGFWKPEGIFTEIPGEATQVVLGISMGGGRGGGISGNFGALRSVSREPEDGCNLTLLEKLNVVCLGT